MRERALVVDRHRGEAVRRALVDAGALRPDLEILEEGGRLALPLRAGASVEPGWGTVEEREFPPRSVAARGEFADALAWPSERKALLPRAFDVVGEIVLVRLPEALEPFRFEVGEALLGFVPGCRLVGLDRGVQGPERKRSVERIAGGGPWSTRHRENRLELDVDVEHAYFSPRLAGEHARLAARVERGERVYDLCCGVGPFAVTIARDGRAAAVTAVDLNGEAIALLRATLARYAFATPVRPVEASVEAFAPTAPPVERVIVNLPREGIKYAALVAPLVVPGGRLHFYDVVSRDEVDRRRAVVEEQLTPHGRWAVADVRRVHPYSPSHDLIAIEAERRGT